MRKLVLLCSLLIAGASCGTDDPFARGEPSGLAAGGGSGGGGGEGGGTGEGGGGAGVSFALEVAPALGDACGGCHAGGVGGLTIVGDASDYDAVHARVNVDEPRDSLLLSKARGEAHGGGAILTEGENPYDVIEAWIASGAPNN